MTDNNFESEVNNFMHNRMEKAGVMFVQTSEYTDLSREEDILLAKIKAALPEYLHNDLNKLDELHNEMGGIESEFNYKQGFSDAVKIIVKTLSL